MSTHTVSQGPPRVLFSKLHISRVSTCRHLDSRPRYDLKLLALRLLGGLQVRRFFSGDVIRSKVLSDCEVRHIGQFLTRPVTEILPVASGWKAPVLMAKYAPVVYSRSVLSAHFPPRHNICEDFEEGD